MQTIVELRELLVMLDNHFDTTYSKAQVSVGVGDQLIFDVWATSACLVTVRLGGYDWQAKPLKEVMEVLQGLIESQYRTAILEESGS